MVARPTSEERAAVEAVLGPPASAWDGGERRMDVDGHVLDRGADAGGGRTLLLPALRAVQEHVGWISPGALGYVCTRLSVPPAEAYGVASFYAMLASESRPRTSVHVCDDIGCIRAGGPDLLEDLRAHGSAIDMAVEPTPCLGMCEQAPAVLVQGRVVGEDTTAGAAHRAAVEDLVRGGAVVPAAD